MSGTEPHDPARPPVPGHGAGTGYDAGGGGPGWASPHQAPTGPPERPADHPSSTGREPGRHPTDLPSHRPPGQQTHPGQGYPPPGQGFPQSGQGYPQSSQNYPPPGQGYPPPGQGGWAQPLRKDYAHWGRRVGASLIDSSVSIVAVVLFYVWYVRFLLSTVSSFSSGGFPRFDFASPLLVAALVVYLVALGLTIWNRWITGGRTGQSIGKRVLKIRLILEATNEPIGALNAFARDLLHVIDGAAYVGYLWPLWDDKRQTFADKLMNTIVVDAPRTDPTWPHPRGSSPSS